MGKIGDLIVRLKLQYQDYKAGLKKAEAETKGFSDKLSKTVNGIKMGWAAAGAAVLAFGREMIAATNMVCDAWGKTVGGMQNAWQQMLSNLSNMSWKELLMSTNVFTAIPYLKKLLAGTNEAAAAGKAMAEAFDAEFELENSLKIQRAKITGELADLQVEMANASLSAEQRKAAADRYKALLEPLYEAEIETRTNMLNAAIDAWLAGQDINASREDVIDYFTNVGTDPSGMAAKYAEIDRVYNKRKGDKANQPIFDAVTKLAQAENGLATELKKVNKMLNTLKETEPLITIDDLIQGVEDIDLSDIEKIDPMDWDAILGNYDAPLDKFVDKWRATQEEVAQLNAMLEGAIATSMRNGMQALTDMLVGLEGADASQLMAALLQPFADTMISLGEMLIAEGLAIAAFKESLSDLNPGVALAAGATLLALGSALSSGIKRLGQTAGSGATATSTGASSSTSGVENIQTEMTIYVKGQLKGSDIVLSGQRTLNNWAR